MDRMVMADAVNSRLVGFPSRLTFVVMVVAALRLFTAS
jgi:hypothetical protein